MRFSEIIDVTADQYPLASSGQNNLNKVDLSKLTQIFDNPNYQIYSSDRKTYYMAIDKNAIGLINLSGWERGNYVLNVYFDPKFQSKGYGYAMYKYLIHQEQKTLSSSAAQTPSSRKIWNHLHNDKAIKITGSDGKNGDYVDDIYFDGETLQSNSVKRKSLVLYATSN